MFSGAIPAQGSRSRELAVMPAVRETVRRLRMVFGCAGRALAVTADPGRAGGRGRPCSRWRSRPTVSRASVSADGRSSGRRLGHGELLRAARATEHPLDPRRWTWRRNRSRKRGQFAPIAQLDRASVFGTECRGFESLWACSLRTSVRPPRGLRARTHSQARGCVRANPAPTRTGVGVPTSYLRSPAQRASCTHHSQARGSVRANPAPARTGGGDKS